MPFALPDYLTQQTGFDQCPPGHRFGLYFDGWDAGWSKVGNKTEALKKLAGALPECSSKALAALQARQTQAAQAFGADALIYPVELTAPLATGLGNEHPLENGFAFLNPYGLPYLAGSGAKGVLRRAAEELASGEWGDAGGWTQPVIDALFGPGEERVKEGVAFRRGALAFWDVFFSPGTRGSLLKVDIMTPHHSDYLQASGSPHANGTPTPIPFLAIGAGARAILHIVCTPALIPEGLPELRSNWQSLLETALTHAGEWLGFGAKGAVGYGRLAIDEGRRDDIQRKADDARKAQEKLSREAEEARQREAMLPWQQIRHDVLKAKPKDQKDDDALLKALEAGRWPDPADARQVAAEIAESWKTSKQWREKSEKKNPEKDEPYQKTLRLKRLLG